MNTRFARLATRFALPAALLVAGPFYLSLLLPAWRSWMRGDQDPRHFLAAPIYIHHAFMSSQTLYLAASLLTACMLVAGMLGSRGRQRRALLAIALLALLAVPGLYRYSPPVEAKAGYEMRWPTHPGLIEGVAKRCQTVFETPCSYRVLGWNDGDELIYFRNCNGPFPVGDAHFAYEPEHDRLREIEPVDERELAGHPAAASARLNPSPRWRERLGYLAYTSQHGYGSPFEWMIPEPGKASPDNHWVAVRTRHAIYRAEDIVVLRAMP